MSTSDSEFLLRTTGVWQKSGFIGLVVFFVSHFVYLGRTFLLYVIRLFAKRQNVSGQAMTTYKTTYNNRLNEAKK